MRKISVFLTTILLLLPAGAGRAQQFGRNKVQYKDFEWRVLSTPHFDIHFYQGEDALAVRTGLIMENGYRMLARRLKQKPPWKIPVILYASHNDFQQTNVSLGILPEGVQAFAEPSRKRIVLPFTGSMASFQHTAVHELAHVFTFNIVYNRLLDNVFSRNYLFALPLWLVEGLAEYLSVGWDSDSDMYIRDAVIYDYLIDLDSAGGYYVYKEGQSVMNYIADTYGKEKILDILDVLSATRSAGAALERTIGLDTERLSRRWKKALRKRYWPMYANKEELEDIGRRLTDHVREHGYYNTKPVFSPDGEKIAFFSDRDGLISIYVMSALDGKILRKLVTGERSNRFESLHAYTSSLSFSPDGTMLAFVAKAGGRDVLYIMSVDEGKVLRKIDVYADALAGPDWSPMGSEIVLSAISRGQSDLVLVDLETGGYKRLTNDADDQLMARFFPDGRRIVFACYPNPIGDVPVELKGKRLKVVEEMDFLDPSAVKRGLNWDIYTMDLETGVVKAVVRTPGDDTSPVVLADGTKIVFSSNEAGINNLYIADIATGGYHRFTDVLGGLFTPDVNERKGRITFSAFVAGGWDIYVSDDLNELLERNFQEQLPLELASAPGESGGGDKADSLTASSRESGREGGGSGEVVVRTDTLTAHLSVVSSDSLEEGEARLGSARDSLVEGVDVPVAGEEVENRGGKVTPYKLHLSPDFIGQGAGLYFSTGFGFGLSNTIALSDLLGNHRLLFSFNFYRDIKDSDFLFTYFYLKKRIDYGFGIFQFKNFLNSRVTSIGENFLDYRLFTERNYGVYALVSLPFSTFNRLDLEFEGFVSEREFFEQIEEDPLTNTLYYTPSRRSRRRLIEPTISYVHDASFFSYYGPVEGSRYIFSLSKGIAFGGKDVSRTTAFLDYRWYKTLFYRNSLAVRLALAASEGKDPRSFFLGGPVTLRGYDYLAFQGTRIALLSIEYRYPLLEALILGWPKPWGFRNVGGTLFFDAGAAWDRDDITPLRKDVRGIQFQDIHGDFGFGTYLGLGFLVLNFQFAWQTDLRSVGESQFHFFLGPAF